MTREEDIWNCEDCGQTQGRHDMWFDGKCGECSKYPFNEGDDYYTIEGNDIVWSCWDEVSEEIHDENPGRDTFATREQAQARLDESGLPFNIKTNR